MTTPSVLVVENDPLLTQSLKNHCKHKGIRAQFTGKLSEALDLIEQEKFSVVVVDRMLDDGDGIQLVEYLHDISPQTKVLVCSNLGSEHDRIRGLETGADAYLPKPFSFSEFSLILEKLFRVHKQLESHLLHAGGVILDTRSGIVRIGCCTKQLRKKETQLLACLMIHKNTVVSRDDLIEYVWGITNTQPNYNTLDVYIRRIRMTFGKEHAHYIQTKRSFGYQLAV